MYGWGTDNFAAPEAQFPYQVPLAYFKGPPSAILTMAIANEEITGVVIVLLPALTLVLGSVLILELML